MYLAAVIQVAVGIIFVFILLSIVVTEVNSLIARATKLRAKTLRATINSVIEDPVIRAKVYTHPLIQLVKAEPLAPTQRISRDEAEAIANGAIGSVDYIEAHTFVDVVLNTIKAESDQQLFGALLNVIDGMPAGAERRGLRVMVNRIVTSGQGMSELRNSLRYVEDRRYRSALTEIVNQIDEEVSLLGLEPTTNVSLMAGIHQISNPNLRNALSTVMASAENMEVARSNLESWFNNSMQRASASYAGKMKNLSIVVALFFALALNIDTLHIARTLWEDPARREQISSEASFSVRSGEMQSQLDGNEADDEFRAAQTDDVNSLEDAIETGASVAYQLQDIQDLRLPIGWSFQTIGNLPAGNSTLNDPNNLWNYFPQNNPDGWLGLLAAKFFGIAATVIAAAQGAPFWFGIVNKILRR
ncbi:MAG: hypothetical protein OXG23_08115 [Chloroflexi bacterium]|nr:hypothetical protein [Chloroflexota bacterium]